MMPASSHIGASLRKRNASVGVHGSALKIRPLSTKSRTKPLFSAALCTGDSRFSNAALLPAPAYSCSARPSGRCCTRDWLEMRDA